MSEVLYCKISDFFFQFLLALRLPIKKSKIQINSRYEFLNHLLHGTNFGPLYIGVVFASLLLTLNIFQTFFSVSICNFEKRNSGWERYNIDCLINEKRKIITRCLRPATLLKKETPAQVFSCEFCEISKNSFFTEHLWTTAS